MDTPETGVPADSDAGATARHPPDAPPVDSPPVVIETDGPIDDFSTTTTEHLRRLWLAGARSITVTYDADGIGPTSLTRAPTHKEHPP